MNRNKGMLTFLVKLEKEYRKVGKIKDADKVKEHIAIVKSSK